MVALADRHCHTGPGTQIAQRGRRRIDMRAHIALTAFVFGTALAFTETRASAPQVQAQAPGFYRMTLGDFTVTALCDGTFDLPVDQLLTNVQPAEVTALLQRQFLQAPVETSVNA